MGRTEILVSDCILAKESIIFVKSVGIILVTLKIKFSSHGAN